MWFNFSYYSLWFSLIIQPADPRGANRGCFAVQITKIDPDVTEISRNKPTDSQRFEKYVLI